MTAREIPWPRIGQIVKLRSGQEAEVLTVLRGADALRPKREVEMLLLASLMQSEFGMEWPNLYYEATVQLQTPAATLLVVTPRDVTEVRNPD